MKKKQSILMLVAIIGLIVITAGVTYAFFNYAKEGTTDNAITTGSITFLYTEVNGVGRGISIDDAFPISDAQGKAQTGEGKVFDFKVTSTTQMDASIPYEVTARKKTGSTLDESAVKLYLTTVDGNTETEVLLDNYNNLDQTSKVSKDTYTEKTIYTGRVPANQSNYEQNFRLRMWIDSDVKFSPNPDGTYPYNDKTFTVTVNVYANAKVVTEEDLKAEITNLTVDGVEVTEVTGKDYNYEVNLPEGTTSTTINVETVSEYATVEVEKLDSLAYSSRVKRLGVSKTLDLVNGDNYFKITVISENGEVENSYKLKIKVGKENINTLSSLSVSGCTLSPTFNSATASYTCTVEYNVVGVTVYPETTSELAKVEVTGNSGLVAGNNNVNIVVTAEDGTEKTYTITVTRKEYKEALLNGADPVLTNNLVPVKISNTGVVTKADLSSQWYDYETKNWANAVVLKSAKAYANGATIPESNIESYFVWIPKYSYKLWDLGKYSGLTTIDSTKPHAISIKFGLTNTSDTVSGECTTPKTAGSTGNCGVGEYMTHPAFLAFNTNGIWVGKFETGYNGATSTTSAEINSGDSSKIIIKPNVYSWRGITTGNMFKASYNYLRSDESHMMKNTEWGAVAYLSHSIYGTCTATTCNEVRINNNSAYITGYMGISKPTVSNSTSSINGNRYESTSLGKDGTYTINYFNTSSLASSTTGNYTGVYDMSGGAWEYTMGYTVGASTVGGLSGIIGLYPDFFTNSNWNKYYDKYTMYSSDDNTTIYNNAILGDSTSELGPFAQSQIYGKSSWYDDYALSLNSLYAWAAYGGYFADGIDSGIFAFSHHDGSISSGCSFRIVLAP